MNAGAAVVVVVVVVVGRMVALQRGPGKERWGAMHARARRCEFGLSGWRGKEREEEEE
jgi:hypothetical protein